jgi:hypothetical protein
MLKLTYNRAGDKFRTVTVLGDYEGIRDLFWQLTHNYNSADGTAIGEIVVTNLDGEVQKEVMRDHAMRETFLSRL